MIKYAIYDFDKTIYRKDTGIEVIKQIFLCYPQTLRYITKILSVFFLYILKRSSSKEIKEVFFSPLEIFTVEEWNNFITSFWNREKKYLFPKVVDQIKQDKKMGYKVGIISASAEIFLTPMVQELQVDFVIGTLLENRNNYLSGKIIGNNCKRQEKVVRLYEYLNNKHAQEEYLLEKMYSDSLNDLPLFEICRQQYSVDSHGNIQPGLPKPNNNI